MHKVTAAVMLLICSFPAFGANAAGTSPVSQTSTNESSITVEKQPTSISSISMDLGERATLRVKVPRAGVKVSVDCSRECSEIVQFITTSATVQNGYADFAVQAQEKAGSQVVTFKGDGLSTQAKIEITKPAPFHLAVKGVTDGKPLDLIIGQDNTLSVEVKKGDAPAADGTYVEATIQNADEGLSGDNLSFPDKEVKTKDGVAMFHLRPTVPEDATATVQFKVKDSDSTAELNLKTSGISFYQALVKNVVGQLFDYIAILAAIGTAAFGLLEALKWGDRPKGYVHALLFKEHLKRPRSPEETPWIVCIISKSIFKKIGEKKKKKEEQEEQEEQESENIERDIIASAYGVFDESRRKIFLRQKIETIITSAKTACDEVLNKIEADRQHLAAFIDTACPPNPALAPDKDLARRKADLEAFFDAIQADIAARWTGYNQLAALTVSVILTVIIAWTSGALLGHVVKTFILAVVGGLLAPFAKDVTTNVSSLVSKLKGQ